MRSTDDITEFLTHVPLFEGLEKRQLKKLAGRFVRRDYNAGQPIVTQGRGGEGLFVVVEGGAEAIRQRGDGSQVVVNRFGPTDFFGELALLDDGPRTASVVATEDTQCLVLTRWDFTAALKGDADMGLVIAQELAKRFRIALDRAF